MTTNLYPKTILFCLMLVLSITSLFAQAPMQMNYQGVARDQSGNPLANQVLRIRVTIRNASAIGTAEYSETRGVTTNNYGLFNFAIGSPGAIYSTGLLSTVNWGAGTKFMQVELDAAGNNNFVDLGATQLLSVPYALYALNSGSGRSVALADNGVQVTDSTFQLGNKVGDSTSRFLEDREIPLNRNSLFLNNGRVGINTNANNDGQLTVNASEPLVPSLSFRSTHKAQAHSIMVHKGSEAGLSGTSLDWSFNMQDYPDVQHDGVAHTNNTVYQYGWNLSPWGDRADPTKPAFLHSWEQRYAIGDYGDCSEYHVVGVSKLGQARRHWSVLSSHDGYNSYQYWMANAYYWYADSSQEYNLMSLSKNGTLGVNGEDAKLDFRKDLSAGGSQVIRQLGSTGRMHGLLGLNPRDEIQIGDGLETVFMPYGDLLLGGGTKSSGVIYNDADKHIHIGKPEAGAVNARNILQVNGGAGELLKLKAWGIDKTWSHGITPEGHYYIGDGTSGNSFTLKSRGGMIVPQLTGAERDNIPEPSEGEIIYNKTAVDENGHTGVFQYYRSDEQRWVPFFNQSKNISNTDLVFSEDRIMHGNNKNLAFSAFNRLQLAAAELSLQSVDKLEVQTGKIAVTTTGSVSFDDAGGRYRFTNLGDQTQNTPNGYLAIDDSGYVFRAGGGIFRQVSTAETTTYKVTNDDYTIQLAELTQTSQLILPDPAGCKGRVLVLWNSNKSALSRWKTDRPIFESFSKSTNVLPNESSIQVQSDGVRWIKIN
jgi:hypothetical protein